VGALRERPKLIQKVGFISELIRVRTALGRDGARHAIEVQPTVLRTLLLPAEDRVGEPW